MTTDHEFAARSSYRWWRDPVLWRSVSLASIGVFVSLMLTRSGIGLDSDSAVYLGVARNLAHGRGPTAPLTFFTDAYSATKAFQFHGSVPSTHFPPLYPAVLAFGELLGMSGVTSARVVAALLSGVNLVLVGFIVARVLVRRSEIVVFAGSLVVLFLAPWLRAHTYALSEALFLTFVLAALLAIGSYVTNASGRAMLVASACCTSAVLTRWVGASIVIACAVIVVLPRSWSVRRRAVSVAAITGPAVTAALLWTAYGTITGGSGPRAVAYHPPHRFWTSVLDATGLAVVHPNPFVGRTTVFVIVVVLLVSATAWAWSRNPRTNRPDPDLCAWTLGVCAIFAASYIAVVFLARTFFDASIPTTFSSFFLAQYGVTRIFLPVAVVTVVLVLAGIDRLVETGLRRRSTLWRSVAMTGACAVLIAIPFDYPLDALRTSADLVNATRLRPGPMASVVRALPGRVVVVSDHPAYLWPASQRDMLEVPLHSVVTAATPNNRYAADVKDMSAILCHHDGVLALSLDQTIADDFSRYVRLSEYGKYSDGTLYRVEPC